MGRRIEEDRGDECCAKQPGRDGWREQSGGAGEKLRRKPMKVDVEIEQGGERVDRGDGWQKAVMRARRSVEERTERQEREKGAEKREEGVSKRNVEGVKAKERREEERKRREREESWMREMNVRWRKERRG